MPMTLKQKQFLQLIKRSKPLPDGRYRVSKEILPVVGQCDIPYGWITLEVHSEGHAFLTMHEPAKILMQYAV